MAADSDGKSPLGFSHKALCLGHKIGKLAGSQLRQLSLSGEEENDLIQTVFTCHGNLDDPDFPQRFSHLLEQLSSILCTRKEALMRRVKKVEPWNSVRVTLTIPREAAARLRALAAAGDAALQALGILSVQLEGDQVISLRLASRFGGEPQEIVLRASNGAGDPPVSAVPSTSSNPVAALINAVAGTSGSSGFRSPNVVAPPTTSALIPPSPRPLPGPSPFPFTSMTHAAQTKQARQESPHHNFATPPPYPSKSFTLNSQRVVPPLPAPSSSSAAMAKPAPIGGGDPPVAMSSPLLVNLLQTDGKDGKQPAASPRPRQVNKSQFPARPVAPRFPVPPPPVQRFVVPTTTATVTTPTPVVTPLRPPPPFPAPNAKEHNQHRSVIQGYSQITALSSKPCTSAEASDKVDEKNSTADGKKLIINPLTGELEPMPSESSESEEEVPKDDPFVYAPSPNRVLSDEDSMMSRRNDASDQSDSETTNKSNGSEIGPRRRASAHKPAPSAPEKIKLRFMVDKPEPGQPAYKVDLSFSPTIRKAISSGNRVATPPPSCGSSSAPSPAAPGPTPAGEEPRVPPLHISLRGRNATVVSNKKKPPHWLDEDPYTKLTKKKLKLGSGGAKEGRDIVAITNCDQTQKPKRAKVKRLLGVPDGEGLKLKIPVTHDMDATDLCDEKLSKKRKDSKKVKNNLRHSDSDGDGKPSLKMDSEEWISRTLKEESLRNSALPADSEPASESAVSQDTTRTSVFNNSNFELSELLRSKKLDNSTKKLDCVKSKNKLLDIQLEETEVIDVVSTSIKKPQEIGGKIKSELSSKIDRVSGKLKNDLSKDGTSKKKLEDPAVKGKVRTKILKKESPVVRIPSLSCPETSAEVEDVTAMNRTKRRHSGDLSAPESQAQKVKRSSSSEGPPTGRRFDTLPRKNRKDSVIERLRKDKLSKVLPVNAKVPVGTEPASKKLNHASSSLSGKTAEKSEVVVPALTALVEVKPVLTRLDVDPEKLKEAAGGVEGNTQGEDSGIESMDALSEKSPNQGESPARKDDASKDLDDGKKGQNHDRTEQDVVKELPDNSCLTMGNSNQETQPPQAHSVPFTECSSQNNNSVEPEPDTSTKINEPAGDSLIESFESKIREAFRRDEDPSREGLAAKILEGSSKDWNAESTGSDSAALDVKPESGKDSPSFEDMERFRVKPPLYTYAKREDSLSPSPVSVESHEQSKLEDEDSNSQLASKPETDTSVEKQECERNHVKCEGGKPESEGGDSANGGRCHRNNNKSLLEQLLIEIPPDDTRRTRSWNKIGASPGGTPKSSPRPNSPTAARPSPRGSNKPSPTPRATKRPTKRKCSENAAELIKACMGVEESKAAKASVAAWKKGEMESSDDEPLSDLARSREQSVEHDVRSGLLKSKPKLASVEEESRNNNKVGVKPVIDTPTRRSVRQGGKAVKTLPERPDRAVRSTRSALSQESGESVSKRRRTSRDTK